MPVIISSQLLRHRRGMKTVMKTIFMAMTGCWSFPNINTIMSSRNIYDPYIVRGVLKKSNNRMLVEPLRTRSITNSWHPSQLQFDWPTSEKKLSFLTSVRQSRINCSQVMSKGKWLHQIEVLLRFWAPAAICFLGHPACRSSCAISAGL